MTSLYRLTLSLCLAASAQALDIDSLWDYDHPNVSAQRFQKALNASDVDPTTHAELLTQLARAQGMQSKFADANRALDEVQGQLAQLPPEVSVRYMLERGRLIQTQGDIKRAWRWYHSAMLLSQKDNLDTYTIDAMHMLALAENGKAAIEWNLKALALAESSASPRANDWKASLYNNLGWLYHDQKDNTRALEYLRKAQAWHEQQGSDKPLLIARWSVARMLRLAGEPDKALPIQLDLERAWNKRGEEDGYVYEEIAECLLAVDRREEAKPYFAKAYTVESRDPWLAQHDGTRLARLQRMGR